MFSQLMEKKVWVIYFWTPFTWKATQLPPELSHLLFGPQPGIAASRPRLDAGLMSKWAKAPRKHSVTSIHQQNLGNPLLHGGTEGSPADGCRAQASPSSISTLVLKKLFLYLI